MCAEIIHKVMRQQTLLDILHDCYNQDKLDYKVRILIINNFLELNYIHILNIIYLDVI